LSAWMLAAPRISVCALAGNAKAPNAKTAALNARLSLRIISPPSFKEPARTPHDTRWPADGTLEMTRRSALPAFNSRHCELRDVTDRVGCRMRELGRRLRIGRCLRHSLKREHNSCSTHQDRCNLDKRGLHVGISHLRGDRLGGFAELTQVLWQQELCGPRSDHGQYS
jgi:hypothetical protein